MFSVIMLRIKPTCYLQFGPLAEANVALTEFGTEAELVFKLRNKLIFH